MPRFKSIIFYQNRPKMKLFLKKCKIFKRWRLRLQTPKTVLPLRISGYAPGNFAQFIIICFFVALVLSNFFLIVAFVLSNFFALSNLMMLTIAVCLMLNCFMFEKFCIHYALCDFDSILWHCTNLFIRQSIDRKQIFDDTFRNLPIEKSCVRPDYYYYTFTFIGSVAGRAKASFLRQLWSYDLGSTHTMVTLLRLS